MQYKQNYGGAIWTNHALERLGQRRMTQDIAWQAFQHPDEQAIGKQTGTIEFRKRFGQILVTIIATRSEHKEWIIVSCWADPPFAGSIDIPKQEAWRNYRTAFTHAGFWGKFWIEIKHQLGLSVKPPASSEHR